MIITDKTETYIPIYVTLSENAKSVINIGNIIYIATTEKVGWFRRLICKLAFGWKIKDKCNFMKDSSFFPTKVNVINNTNGNYTFEVIQ